MQTGLNGITMAYQERRQVDRPVLLLVHGFPLDSRMWSAQLEGLAGEARLIAPDLRGHGRSDAPAGPYTGTRMTWPPCWTFWASSRRSSRA